MSKRARFFAVTLAITVAAGIMFYFKCSYFFNPLTFRHDEITHLPWTWYKNPLQLEYAVLDEDGWKLTTVTDQEEIMLVFRELRRGGEPSEESPGGDDRAIWIGVRRQEDGAILLSAEGREHGDCLWLKDAIPVALTLELRQLVGMRLEQARNLLAQRNQSDNK